MTEADGSSTPGSNAPATYCRLYLVGFMGCGKSTIGKLLAARLNWTFLDLDAEIEEQANTSIVEIFERGGEALFRELEHQTLGQIAGREYLVVATGGGTFQDRRNVELIDSTGLSLWLDPPIEVIVRRLERSRHRRPLFRDPDQARTLHRDRLPRYRLARCHLELSGTERPQEAADRAYRLIGDPGCAI